MDNFIIFLFIGTLASSLLYATIKIHLYKYNNREIPWDSPIMKDFMAKTYKEDHIRVAIVFMLLIFYFIIRAK